MEGKGTGTKKKLTAMSGILCLVIVVPVGLWLFHSPFRGIGVGRPELLSYRSEDFKANLTHCTREDCYIAVCMSKEDVRVGIFGLERITGMVGLLNQQITDPKEISEEEFEKAESTAERLYIQGKNEYEFAIASNASLVRVKGRFSTKYFNWALPRVRSMFSALSEDSKDHTDRAMALSAAELKKRKRWFDHYSLKGVNINLSSDRPIVLVFEWTGCLCSIQPDEMVELSVRDVLWKSSPK